MSTVHDLLIGGHIKPLRHSPLKISAMDKDHSVGEDQLNVGAHVLTFDDSDALLKVMCPSFPSLYLVTGELSVS